MDIAAYRKLFPITKEYVFTNHASVSAPPEPVIEALQQHLMALPTTPFDHLREQILAQGQRFKEKVAELIGAARSDEIVAMSNTAMGINTAANSLPLKSGDNVLVLEGDYPANIYPWMNLAPKGVLVKWVPQKEGGLDLNVLEARIDKRTQVIALSTAMFATGYKNDIKAVGALCKQRGIYFVVDGIQTLGAFPMNVQEYNIDFLAAGSQKWLMSTPGSGFLYCRHELLDELQPGAYVGTLSMVDPFNFLDYNFTLQDNSDRFSLGTGNFAGQIALTASIDLILEAGINQVAERILQLTSILINDLQEDGHPVLSNLKPQHRSGIVIVGVDNPQATYERLLAEHIVTSVRGAGLRITPHFYNTEEEMHRIAEVLGSR